MGTFSTQELKKCVFAKAKKGRRLAAGHCGAPWGTVKHFGALWAPWSPVMDRGALQGTAEGMCTPYGLWYKSFQSVSKSGWYKPCHFCHRASVNLPRIAFLSVAYLVSFYFFMSTVDSGELWHQIELPNCHYASYSELLTARHGKQSRTPRTLTER